MCSGETTPGSKGELSHARTNYYIFIFRVLHLWLRRAVPVPILE